LVLLIGVKFLNFLLHSLMIDFNNCNGEKQDVYKKKAPLRRNFCA